MPEHPSRSRTIRVESEISEELLPEFQQLMAELTAGKRPRMETLEREVAAIEVRATRALSVIVKAIDAHPTTGQAKRLVRFLAGVYNGQDYPFALTELRGLDTGLAGACLDYLNYDRLGIAEVHMHLPGGEAQLHGWMRRYGLIGQEGN